MTKMEHTIALVRNGLNEITHVTEYLEETSVPQYHRRPTSCSALKNQAGLVRKIVIMLIFMYMYKALGQEETTPLG